MKISILYLGKNKYKKYSKDNHKKIFELFDKNNIKYKIIYNTKDENTTMYSGLSQVTDFYEGIGKCKYDNFIKLRTDLFLSDIVILDILNSLINYDNNYTIAYSNEIFYDKKNKIINKCIIQKTIIKSEKKKEGMNELILISNKKNINNSKIVKTLKKMPDRYQKIGNRAWRLVFNNNLIISKLGSFWQIRDTVTSYKPDINENIVAYICYKHLLEKQLRNKNKIIEHKINTYTNALIFYDKILKINK